MEVSMNPSTALRKFLSNLSASPLSALMRDASAKLTGAREPSQPIPGQAPVRMEGEPLPDVHIEPIEDER
jgi:hypothetical protein